jgi:hypothetical protein
LLSCAAIAGALLILAGSAPAGASSPRAPRAPRASRVLVVSLPATTWAQYERDSSQWPNLSALLGQSALADMNIRGTNYKPTLADGYVTVGTGARAEARPAPPPCTLADGRWHCAGQHAIAKHNDAMLYDAKAGLLASTLDKAGVQRSVTAPGSSSYAPLALADPTGNVAADGDQARTDRSVTLAEVTSDDMLDPLLAGVDAVIVVSPSQPPGPIATTVAALRAPGVAPGLMKSAYTGRAGTVSLIDVAPTVLDLLGIHRPEQMEGRPFISAGSGGATLAARVHRLADTNERAQFRDAAITQVDGVYLASAFVLAGAALVWFFFGRRPPVVGGLLDVFALALLFLLPATYLAMLVPGAHKNMPGYWLCVVSVSLAAALLVRAVFGARSLTPLMIALGAVVGLIIVDVVTGARLQFNGAFGYSPTIGGRYAGLGNLGYAQLAAGAVLLAGLLAHRIGGRAGWWCAAALLGLAIVVDGAPFFGADVGGVLSMVPAYAVTLALLAGWKFRWRLVAAGAAAGAVLLALFVAIDMSRQVDQRTHLGRVLGGGGDLSTVLARKFDASYSILQANPFAWLLPIVFVGVAIAISRFPGPLDDVRRRVPEIVPALVGLAIVAFLGTVLNDSGLAITGIMFGIVVSVLIVCSVRLSTREVVNA